MINAPYDTGQDRDAERERSREALVSRAEGALGVDLEDLITCEGVLTPPEIRRRTGSERGAPYGISPNTRSSAFLRQRNRSRL